ncbi:MAG: hypothetical protein C0600_03995 [Ignavibacteria bacterium]|nr:MAG: hypothetical protein C0600_03995 [Ignavibacteria bacterium]
MKHSYLSLIAAVLLLAAEASADRYTFLGSYEAHAVNGRELTITATNNVLRLTLIDSAIVRIQVGREGTIQDIPSYAVIHRGNPLLTWELEDQPGELLLRLPAGVIHIQKFPLRMRFADAADSTLAQDEAAFGHSWDGKEFQVWRSLQKDEKFYGLGEKTGNVNKRGFQWVMWNSDFPGYGNDQDPLYASVPFFIGVHNNGAYGTFLDNSFRSVFNMGAGNNRMYSFGADDGELNYYFIFGPTIREVVQRYTSLTGRMPLPPMWALGYQQCRWSYYPEYEFRDLARNFRQRRIPADVLYLDIRYMDRFKVFTWDTTAFPDPQTLFSDLEDMGFKVITIVDPGVKIEKGYRMYEEGIQGNFFARYPDGELFSGEVWPKWCHFPDFSQSAARGWWGDKYGEFMQLGVDGFWIDMNEPAVWGREFPYLVEFDDDGRRSTIKKIHNVYGHLMAQSTYEGMQRGNAGKRPFIVTRAGFAGTQRYAAMWTGDNNARFENLRMALRTCQGLGLSGLAFCGPDAGGFYDTPSHELYMRWIEAGVFTPFLRTHSTINTSDQEPWSFGEWTEDVVRNYLNMRYELLPYLYTEFRRASQTGDPFMRPLFYDYQDDAECFSSQWQHTFTAGPQILVAPVVEEGRRFQEVYLPPGRWYDPWSGITHEGGRRIVVEAPVERLPYFYRGGAIVPRRAVQQYSGEKPLEELILDIVPADSATYTVYLDKGDGMEYLSGAYAEIRIMTFSDGLAWNIEIESTDNAWTRKLKTLRFQLLGSAAMPREVHINDEPVLFESASEREAARVVQDVQRRRFEISLPFTSGRHEFHFEY